MHTGRNLAAALFSTAILLAGTTAVKAEDTGYSVTFQGTVTDAGQYVSGMTIDYGSDVISLDGIDTDTYTVKMTSTVAYGADKGTAYKYYDASAAIPIVKVSTSGSKVTVYFNQNTAPTLNWLSEGRNTPAVLSFTVAQNEPITAKKTTSETTLGTGTRYICSATGWQDLEDSETAKFTSVLDDINYEYHKGTNKKLIVWFHGNGEGDLPDKATNNNVAQMLANRGTVAWTSEEAEAAFGDATVMAFQSPNMWYLATAKGYLATIRSEIDEVVRKNNLNPYEIYVAGCSAGGYMTTRMLITYPNYFKAAMITCPALELANLRNVQASGNATAESLKAAASVTGATPTDAELESLKKSRTAIWLVQGETDSSVNPENCSKRMWKILSDGKTVTTSTHEGAKGIASDFTTYETKDGKYKLTLYETVDLEDKEGTLGDTRKMGKIVCAEDYDLDGTYEAVKYNDHWSWIFTLRNDPADQSGTHIFQWAAKADYEGDPITMYRLYNPNSGEHFYTASEAEKNNVVAAGWSYEGVGWIAPTSGSPVYRLYNANGGEHHYTLDEDEKNYLVSVGWSYEGVGWYSDANKTVNVYRVYNPNAYANNHHYTTDKSERDHLVSLGWKDEKIGWYALAEK